MNVNTAEGRATREIPSSSTPCIWSCARRARVSSTPSPSSAERRPGRAAAAYVNTADLNSRDTEADDTGCLCSLSAALTGSHGSGASECSASLGARTSGETADCANPGTVEAAGRGRMPLRPQDADEMPESDDHSIDDLDKRLDAIEDSKSTDYDDRNYFRIQFKSSTNPNIYKDDLSRNVDLARDEESPNHRGSDVLIHKLSPAEQQKRTGEQPSKEIKMQDEAREDPADLQLECNEVAPEDAKETSPEVDKDPWTMEVLGVCVSVVLRASAARSRRGMSASVVGLLTAAAVLVGCGCGAAPARLKRDLYVDDKTQNYLMRFGYLPQSSIEVGNLIMEDQLMSAIRSLQAFAGIPETGEIDEATKELLKKRRCGRPDQEEFSGSGGRYKRFVVQGAKWNHTDLTWSLSAARRPSSLDAGRTRGVLSHALSVWAQHSRLTFRELSSDQADIVVSFSRGYHDDAYPFDGRGHILAHAFFPGSGRGGDAHFDDDELWALQPKDKDEEGTSLFAVAAHEFGHSLGLSHSSVKGALMYPWYQGILPNFTLTEDDRNGIQAMYGPKERRVWGKIPQNYPVAPPTTTTTTTTTTRRPHHRHYDRYPPQPSYPYTPTHPRQPERPKYPGQRPDYPYDPNRRRYYNTTEYDPRRTHHDQNPRQNPRIPETTTQAYHPRRPEYPYRPSRPEYPLRPDYPPQPNHPSKPEYPRKPPHKKPVYPENTTARPTLPSNQPDTCDTNYDAVALIRGEVFIFKDKWHWRIGSKGLYAGYPIEIWRMWKELPKDLTNIDAVYERPDRKIAFFIGQKYYLFDADQLMYGYPKPLTHLWLPPSLPKLDAAMVWGHNGKTYFYSGTMYWKFDEEDGHVELDYPRDMSMWKGVGYNIDSVFQWKDGKTYFFKGKGFWKFNDLQMRVEKERQMPSGPFWMGCPPIRSEVGNKQPYNAEPPEPTRSLLSAGSPPAAHRDLFMLLMALTVALGLSFNIT